MLNSSDNYCTEVVVSALREGGANLFCVCMRRSNSFVKIVHLKKKAFQRSTIGFDIDLYYLRKRQSSKEVFLVVV